MISHVVVDARDSLCFRCLHCGGRHLPLLLPMPCEVYASACRGFALMHKHCPKPAAPSKQVELFDALVKSEQDNPNGFGRPGHATYVAGVDTHGRVDPVTFGIIGVNDEPDPLNRTIDVGNGERKSIGAIVDEIFPDEADAERDKPELTTYAEYETGHYAGFAQAYPAARTFPDLLVALARVLTVEQLQSLKGKGLAKLLPFKPEFQDIAHWARVAKAREDAMASAQRGEPGEGGITIPLLPPMPLELQRAMFSVTKTAKKKRARKPARKAKARK
jgi:hypothetical protein